MTDEFIGYEITVDGGSPLRFDAMKQADDYIFELANNPQMVAMTYVARGKKMACKAISFFYPPGTL